ncbi:OSTA/TMEM184 family protein, partial [Aspergillus homomorphus CBS 101889]
MGIFHHDSSSSSHTCPAESLSEVASQPFLHDMSFHTFIMILSGACTAFTCLMIFYLMFLHATHLSKPKEQLKIMRICTLLPLYSVLSFIAICAPEAHVYIDPWLDLFQAVALGIFYLLMLELLAPSSSRKDMFFAPLAIAPSGTESPAESPGWYRKTWIAIFQYPAVALLASIVTDITQAAGVYCLESNKPYFAHLWLTIIINLSLVSAVISVLKFYKSFKIHLKDHQPLAKLLAFKLIVGLSFLEKIIFFALGTTDTLKTNAQLTYADVKIGIPTMVVCIQMVPFALFFHYAYSIRPYVIRKTLPTVQPSLNPAYAAVTELRYQGGPLGVRAWLGLLDPREILSAVRF